jgi:endonuclease/exonuclease/phosphatase family metal-dependent hydrolase
MRLRVLSFNVWGLPPPIGRDVSERLSRVMAELAGFDCDLALFQEVWTEDGRRQLIEEGRRLGYPHSFHPPGPAPRSSGLLALSRLPLRGTRFRRFTLCGLPERLTQMDYYAGKGVARFEVEVGDTAVAILNTHMHARYAPARAVDAYRGHRTAEVIEMAEELLAETGPLVAVGDFNMRDTADEYRVLTGLTGLVDAAAALDVRLPTTTLQNAYRASRGAVNESRLDYVFCRAGLHRGIRPVECRRVYDETIEVAGEPGAYSDHAGVLAELEIGGRGSAPWVATDDAFALASVLLETGRAQARRRRLFVRAGAGACAASAAVAFRRLRRPQLSRRRFLRSGLGAMVGLTGLSTGGLLGLSEGFGPEELAGYDDAEAALSRLRVAAERGRAAPDAAASSLR